MIIIIGKRDIGGLCGQKFRITFISERSEVYRGSMKVNIEYESTKKGKEILRTMWVSINS